MGARGYHNEHPVERYYRDAPTYPASTMSDSSNVNDDDIVDAEIVDEDQSEAS